MKISLQLVARVGGHRATTCAALAHALTMAGLEIEGIERAGPPLERHRRRRSAGGRRSIPTPRS